MKTKDQIMKVGKYEFWLNSDNQFGEILWCWSGEVSRSAQEDGDKVAEECEKAGWEVYSVDIEQQGREDDYYPVVYLKPKEDHKGVE